MPWVCFDVQGKNVLYADQIFEPLYPASTTKIMTAYVALKYGNLDDIVTASERATDFAEDEQVCGLQAGDQLSLRDLLNGLFFIRGMTVPLQSQSMYPEVWRHSWIR